AASARPPFPRPPPCACWPLATDWPAAPFAAARFPSAAVRFRRAQLAPPGHALALTPPRRQPPAGGSRPRPAPYLPQRAPLHPPHGSLESQFAYALPACVRSARPSPALLRLPRAAAPTAARPRPPAACA